MTRELSDVERLDWLRLSRTENVGPITFRRLMGRFGNAAAALDALPGLAKNGGAKEASKPYARDAAQREIDAISNTGARLIAQCEPNYPTALAAIDDAPPLIAIGRNPQLAKRPCIAVIGARNASLNGRKLAETIARDLAAAGMTVVSGLARGIDTAAHQASLAEGTIAVVAGGIDVVYPPENLALQTAIFESGAILSEMPCGMQPTQRLFPRRNRLIAGLCSGTLVVEASLGSGSLITANMALEQGREIFAVPGSPLDPRAAGTNNLIRAGAHLTTCAEDVLSILRDMNFQMAEQTSMDFTAPKQADHDRAELASARASILERLSPSPTEVDEMIRDCHLSPQLVSTVLLELELAGRLERQPGNKVALV